MKKSAAWIATAALALATAVSAVVGLSSAADAAPREIGRVYFDVDSPTLSASEKSQMDALLPALAKASSIRIEGFAGTKATAKSKVKRLSTARAERVAAYLKSKGVTATMQTAGKGFANDTNVRSKMRRVIIYMLAAKGASPKPTAKPTKSPKPKPTPTLSPYSFTASFETYMGDEWGPVYSVQSVGFGADPASAKFSANAAWTCTGGKCQMFKSLKAADGQTAAWVKVKCGEKYSSTPAQVCTWLFQPDDSKWTIVDGPTGDVKYFKTTAISGKVVEPLIIAMLS